MSSPAFTLYGKSRSSPDRFNPTGTPVTVHLCAGSALDVILRLLPELDTTQVHELQSKHLPAARLTAVADQERTRAIQVATSEQPTVAVPFEPIGDKATAAAFEGAD